MYTQDKYKKKIKTIFIRIKIEACNLFSSPNDLQATPLMRYPFFSFATLALLKDKDCACYKHNMKTIIITRPACKFFLNSIEISEVPEIYKTKSTPINVIYSYFCLSNVISICVDQYFL